MHLASMQRHDQLVATRVVIKALPSRDSLIVGVKSDHWPHVYTGAVFDPNHRGGFEGSWMLT
jgi:hypothetical protein